LGSVVRTKKASLEKSLDILIEKAADCSVLAKAQRASADKQHESAHKMEKLGDALIANAAEIKDELNEDADEERTATTPKTSIGPKRKAP
jgi:uncharacterized damage-inducible protein DinB